MKTISSIQDIRQQVSQWKQQGKKVAFVPTMGNLHQGHLTLVKNAKQQADVVVVSIFVNPMQFGQNEDFDGYPRTYEQDSKALIEVGADLLFMPTPDIIYPKGLDKQTFIEVPEIGDEFCGATRPGHFRGVATVVNKLFNIVQPDVALFGRKDFQQLLIIKTMVEDLSMPIEIIGIDTIREPSGLAMSSRNGYLTADEKQRAAKLKQAMDYIAQGLQQGEELANVRQHAIEMIEQVGFKLDYIEVRSAVTLKPANAGDKQLVILAAAYLGKARLIDNMVFELK
ncbi:pantoate--beta-alanine ligase [Shewanella sp. WXL01]|uniref:pantoate--beta-alanine ligase n=1 Tax=Shewanella sp. WXL01 TaxID=2709721 RepID=UPI0014382962|nr:pantoate--beta-alanine ligase [Shewanella sp. WXL01]NKF49537.1 pantoate--beta-alanine ligase [Shewanella sp. WXL01]